MRSIVAMGLMLLVSCSTVSSQRGAKGIEAFHPSEPFTVRVSAGNEQLNTFVREYVSEEFGRFLRTSDSAEHGGTIDVTYDGMTQWNAYGTWQNSTMLVVIHSGSGERLWSAEYTYKGGWELSSLTGTTVAESARTVVKRVARRFAKEHDF